MYTGPHKTKKTDVGANERVKAILLNHLAIKINKKLKTTTTKLNQNFNFKIKSKWGNLKLHLLSVHPEQC